MAKTAAIRNAITQFSQLSGETLCEAWERYKEMLRKCPHLRMPDWMVINCFYNGLGPQSRPMLDAALGGALWAKNYDEAYELIEMMAANEYQNPIQRLHQVKAAGVLDVDAATALTAQIKALTLKMDSLANLGAQPPSPVCELCAGTHATNQCAISSESAQFMSNFQRFQQPAPATYHPNNRNHPNFSWSNNQNFMPQPHDTEANPRKKEVKEQVQDVTLRSRKVTKDKDSSTEHNKEESDQQVETPVLSSKRVSTVFDTDKNEINEEVSKESAEKSSPKIDIGVNQVYPPPPFPKRLQKHKLDKQFAKFLEVFKKLQINIPFAEALEQMLSYAKFMKGILSRKLKLKELETVALIEECSAVLQQKLPPQLKDPGSFTIPCTIGQLSFDKCLYDLGASINLMSLSIFMQLGLPELKPTNMSLQLANRSITYPRGIVEDVLVKVDKLIFPVDFVILDFEEDQKIPIILGRPFLATGQTLIDVQKGELIMTVQDQMVIFNVFNAIKLPSDEEECFKVDVLEAEAHSEIDNRLKTDILERVLSGDSEFGDEEEVEHLQFLNASPWKRRMDPPIESLGLSELKDSHERLKPSIVEAPKLELKQLPEHLRYAFLGEASTLPVIISSNLSGIEEEKLLRILREFKSAIGWTIIDFKGISPSYCQHKILIKEGNPLLSIKEDSIQS
ncbi:uncharacterized protein LOC135147890 [Daucus carota subsp. sativus]|uniref:uncharacterized protein LOC135147890 n=1 Tax=Daucus carota subsp. sativus TaxID=79200 RepID=UPI003083B38C